MQAFLKSMLPVLILTALLAACAPAQNPEQIQSLVQTSVAMTVQAQNQMGTFVAQTVEAQSSPQPADATATLTETPEVAPSLTPVVIPSPTPFAVAPSGGGGGGTVAQEKYSCDFTTVPPDNSQYYRGENFTVKFRLINNGTKQWCMSNSCAGGPDFSFDSGTNFLYISSLQIPPLQPGDSYVVGPLVATAPSKVGTYVMVWKLQGPMCYPAIQIVVYK